jgi:hypothetical protein
MVKAATLALLGFGANVFAAPAGVAEVQEVSLLYHSYKPY